MTKASDVRNIIADQSGNFGEQQALEHLADALAETLAMDVPHRPEFKAQLRQKLMTEARRTLAPWYRRPAFLYSTVAVAAAAAVLAVGLKLWNPPVTPDKHVAVLPTPPAPSAQSAEPAPAAAPRQVNAQQFPPVALPEQLLTQGDPGPAPVAGLDLKSVAVYLVSARPDSAQFTRIARGIGFSNPVPAAGRFQVSEGARTLTMSGDGLVAYSDLTPDVTTAPPVTLDANAVRSAAQNFLLRASLPVPGLEPQVVEETDSSRHHTYVVTYTPMVNGLPLVNGRTVIHINDRYRILAAEAYVQAGQELDGTFAVIAPSEAMAKAQERGAGTFTQADLAYARTSADGATYLQPVWRVFGTYPDGRRMVRYVPALASE